MANIQQILDMVATEAIGGGIGDHYFDESRNKEFIERDNRINNPELNISNDNQLQLEPYDIGLVKDGNGNITNVESEVVEYSSWRALPNVVHTYETWELVK